MRRVEGCMGGSCFVSGASVMQRKGSSMAGISAIENCISLTEVVLVFY